MADQKMAGNIIQVQELLGGSGVVLMVICTK
jgi:hypothetical protein